MKKKDIKNISLIVLLTSLLFLIFIWYLNVNGKAYGSQIDWLNQHVTFAENIRNNFYKTGNLYPDFTWNLGGGQNTAQFIYYGLFRPEILISFLFPMVNMLDYMIISMVFLTNISLLLLYYWLRINGFNPFVCLISCFLFLLAGPVIFHTHRHLMFVSYMPWLMLVLIGTYKYIENNKYGVLLSGIVLTVCSSYYYSVGCLFFGGIYSAFLIKKKDSLIKDKLRKISKVYGIYLIGVGVSSFVLFPVAFMMKQHRGVLQTPSLIDLLKPDFSFKSLMYSSKGSYPYSLGMTVISLFSLLFGCISSKKGYKFLAIVLVMILGIPIFCYLLNGGQYVRAKSLIPMLPLVILQIANMLQEYDKEKLTTIMTLVTLSLFPIIYLNGIVWSTFFLVDILSLCLCLLISFKKRNFLALYLTIPFIIMVKVNMNEKFLTKERINDFLSSDKTQLIGKTIQSNANLYRFDDFDHPIDTVNKISNSNMLKTSIYSSNKNELYYNFYQNILSMGGKSVNNANITASDNPIFQFLMSVKYIYTDKKYIPVNYIIKEEQNGKYIIENAYVLPITYVSNNILAESTFSNLEYPYNLEAIMRNTIVNGKSFNADTTRSIKRANLHFSVVSKDNDVTIIKNEDSYHINAKKDANIKIKLSKSIKNELLIIELPIKNIKNEKDAAIGIEINGIPNNKGADGDIYSNRKRVFRYVLSSNKEWDMLNIRIKKGEFNIMNPASYVISSDIFINRKSSITPVDIMSLNQKGFVGKVNVRENGYFVTSIPYQEGFSVTVDNKKIDYEIVNTAFIGFPIDKGIRKVCIRFEMPGKKLGITITVLLLTLIVFSKIICLINIRIEKDMK